MDHVDFSKVEYPNPQSVIAGTFCLMSCAMRTGSEIYIPKIVDNLNFLTECKGLDPAMRRLCNRIASDWESWLMENQFEPEPTDIELSNEALEALPTLLAAHAETDLKQKTIEKTDAQQFVENLVAGRYHRN